MIEPGTPLPWRVRDDVVSSATWLSAENDTVDLACVGEGWPPSEELCAEQDAAYIVHACNAYPALVEQADALEEALANLMLYHDVPGPVDAPLAPLLRAGFAALAAYRKP
jgi:hypothetical protein